jgi:hypothetical protein
MSTYMIPPAFFEVRQDMLERHLQDLEQNAYEPTEISITQNERLSEPAEQVRNKELVVDCILE